MKRARPPKVWSAREIDRDPTPRISGIGPNGEHIVHPDEWKRLQTIGAIDQHGNQIPRPA